MDQVHLGAVTEAALDIVAVDWEEPVEKMDMAVVLLTF